MNIGERIKEYRNQNGLTQQELANRSELSKGYISQLERNQTSPSISTLIDILQCLGTTPAEFFTDSEPEQLIFKESDYFEKVNPDLKNTIQWIIPNAQKNCMEPVLMTLEPGGSSEIDMPHSGEEFGYVLKGSIKITFGNKTYRADKGESFYFEASKKHYIEAQGKKGAVILWVSSPPNF